MTRVLYCSDLHLGHRLMCTTRGFATIEEHDETVISNWNKAVAADDIVWLLGDVSLRWDDKLRWKLGRLNGTKHLIAGNHDAVFPGHRDAYRNQAQWIGEGMFASIQAYARRKSAGREFLMSHFPYRGDHIEGRPDRSVQYRLRDEGLWLVHGHLHSKDKVTGPRQVHIGLDAWDLRPVPEEEVIALMGKGNGKDNGKAV
jgi:calcineurin-like phosphoesterase family protein